MLPISKSIMPRIIHRADKIMAIEKRIRVLGEKSGIGRRLYPHLIRHTTATTALDRGMNIVDVSKLLGHESVDTTMEYITTDINSIKTHHMNCVI